MLLLIIQICRDASFVESKSNGNLVRRQQAHHTQCPDASASVAAEVDNQPVDPVQFLNRTGDFVRNFNHNHAGKQGDFQKAESILKPTRLDQCGLYKVKLLSLGSGYVNKYRP